MQFITQKTQNLTLRLYQPDTAEYVFSNYSDEDLMDFLGIKTKEDLNIEQERYRLGLVTFNNSFAYFHLIHPTAGNIGWCGFHTLYLDHDRAEIGYVMTNENMRNHGFMKEALQATLTFGFNTMNLKRIEAFAAEYNRASIGLLEQYGFQREGVLRKHYKVNGIHEDSTVFGLLRKDWLTLHTSQ